MPEILRILAPTDLSPAGDRALARAAQLAVQLGGELRVLHVLPPGEILERLLPAGEATGAAGFRDRMEQALRERAQRLQSETGVRATCELRQGRAHEEIVAALESAGATLAVLGAQGERAQRLPPATLGDTVLEVVERARCATLIVRREAHDRYERALACAKGTAGDRAVLEWTNRLLPEDLIHVIGAFDVPYAHRLAAWGATETTIDRYAAREEESRRRHIGLLLGELGLPDARARLHVERGEAVKSILMHAARVEAEIVVLAKRAYAGLLAEGPFGSVARDVALLAPMDVLLVPPL